MMAILWIFRRAAAGRVRSLVPAPAARLGGRLQPGPRHATTRRRRWASSPGAAVHGGYLGSDGFYDSDLGRAHRRTPRSRSARCRAAGASSRRWASKITKLTPVGGFAAETAGAISLFTATHARRPGQHDAHDHRRDRRRRLHQAPVGRPLGRRRPHRLGLDPHDSRLGARRRDRYWSRPPRSPGELGSGLRLRPDRDYVLERLIRRTGAPGAWFLTPGATNLERRPSMTREPRSRWQLDREQRSALGPVRGVDLATVQFDEMLDDREAEAGAAGISCGPRAGLVDAIEALEDAWQIALQEFPDPGRRRSGGSAGRPVRRRGGSGSIRARSCWRSRADCAARRAASPDRP